MVLSWFLDVIEAEGTTQLPLLLPLVWGEEEL